MSPYAPVAAVGLTLLVAEDLQLARFARGTVPLPAAQTVGWQEVVLEVSVNAAGGVDKIETLRATEPLARILRETVGGWSFQPARDGDTAVTSQVLVAALYRPAALYNTPSLGTPPIDRAPASDRVPFPTLTPPPPFPPTTLGDGAVLVEVLVSAGGQVLAALVLQSTGRGFNQGALRAAERWRFRPGRRDGMPVQTYAYVVFGFRQPVIAGPPPRRDD